MAIRQCRATIEQVGNEIGQIVNKDPLLRVAVKELAIFLLRV